MDLDSDLPFESRLIPKNNLIAQKDGDQFSFALWKNKALK